ncbi:MAG: hypothetical protein GX555_01105 [Actinomycetales bacterium]|nr:hypothetical protein [Actinomycetales bacterium]
MATATVAPEVGTRDRAGDLWQVARWVTLGLYAVTMLVTVLTGVRVGTLDDLRSDLERGAVSQVRVVGSYGESLDFTADGAQGVTTVDFVWQDGWHRSAAEVKLASSVEELERQGFEVRGGTFIIGDAEETLRDWSPGVEIVRAERAGGIYSSIAGWEVDGTAAYLPGLLIIAFLLVLVNSPEPRLATRWAWVWLLFSPALVVAVPAYLLGGARGRIPGRWRLGGLGGFIIMLLL